jgi:beta-glucosidase
MTVSSKKKAVTISFDLTNNGSMAADEVVQLYVSRPGSKVEWPVKELKAFERVSLAAGETKAVTLEIPMEELRYWDVEADAWALEHGKLELLLGSASDDIRQKAETKI